MTEEKPKWGGKRTASPGKRIGREKGTIVVPPHLKRNAYSTRLQRWLIDWLRDQDQSQSKLIEEALKQTYGLEPP